MKVAYILSRFPLLTETFILREFDRVASQLETELWLYALFPSSDAVVHEEAKPWIPRCQHGSARLALGATAFWVTRAPRKTARVFLRTVRDYFRSPRLLGKALLTVGIALQHARHIREVGVDHVHAHFATYPALAAWTVHEVLGLPYSITPHAHDIFIDQTGLATKLRAASAVVAVSRYHWMFLQHFGASPARIRRISYGIDLHLYAFRPRPLPSEGPIDVLVISSFKPYKGQKVLLDAIALGGATARRLKIEFIGTGDLEPELQVFARSAQLDSQCRFSGARDQAYVRRRLAQADLLIQPSIVQMDGDTEGLPNTLIEGAATGVTLIATRVTGVPELVEDGVSGFLAEPTSPASLLSAIERADAAGSMLASVQAEARRRVEAHHDLNLVAAALIDVFRGSPNG